MWGRRGWSLGRLCRGRHASRRRLLGLHRRALQLLMGRRGGCLLLLLLGRWGGLLLLLERGCLEGGIGCLYRGSRQLGGQLRGRLLWLCRRRLGKGCRCRCGGFALQVGRSMWLSSLATNLRASACPAMQHLAVGMPGAGEGTFILQPQHKPTMIWRASYHSCFAEQADVTAENPSLHAHSM